MKHLHLIINFDNDQDLSCILNYIFSRAEHDYTRQNL